MDGSTLRDGFDLPIAVDVGFLGLNKPYRGRNPTGNMLSKRAFLRKALRRTLTILQIQILTLRYPLPTVAKKDFPQPIRWGRVRAAWQ
ncbi:hypothetical protein QD46_06120 [Paenibacillus polymyxa]|nr:hypothetical protein QD46_06120 [Paenibacillus polymyxa]